MVICRGTGGYFITRTGKIDGILHMLFDTRQNMMHSYFDM